jgi:biotin-dependent carboxylase-like uncharacterized protein
MIEVLRPGALTTIQDRGRIGWAHLGVPRSGALDAPALARANALVGNDADAAGLEVTLTGCQLRFHEAAMVAVTGANAVVTVDGKARGTSFPVRRGETVRIGPARNGVRTYVAVSGGIAVPPVLGSRSCDTLSGIGPAVLKAGDILPLGPASSPISPMPTGPAQTGPAQTGPAQTGPAQTGPAQTGPAEATPAEAKAETDLRIYFGPRDDWFVRGAGEVLCGSSYTMTVQSNRVGARLAGEPILRARSGELPSEGIVLGSVQITPDGMPIVFLADHPTTGGYPVIGVVDAPAVALLAQVRPGSSVRFHGSQC